MTTEMTGWLGTTEVERQRDVAERAMWTAIALAEIAMLVVGAMIANLDLGVMQTACPYVAP
jgi:hypothetical protein